MLSISFALLSIPASLNLFATSAVCALIFLKGMSAETISRIRFSSSATSFSVISSFFIMRQ